MRGCCCLDTGGYRAGKLLLGALFREECVKVPPDALVQEAGSTYNKNQTGSQAKLSPEPACLWALPSRGEQWGWGEKVAGREDSVPRVTKHGVS